MHVPDLLQTCPVVALLKKLDKRHEVSDAAVRFHTNDTCRCLDMTLSMEINIICVRLYLCRIAIKNTIFLFRDDQIQTFYR